MDTLVKNRPPLVDPEEYRIAIVGDAPGADEARAGEPFHGAPGRFLKALMNKCDLDPNQVMFANISQLRPPGNDIGRFAWTAGMGELEQGMEALALDLEAFSPNLVLLLGAAALHTAKEGANPPLYRSGQHKFPHSITNWRGTIFECMEASSPMFGFKCMATYHPSAVLRQYSWAPVMMMDLRRARNEGLNYKLERTSRDYDIHLSADEIVGKLESLREEKLPVSCDIEGYVIEDGGMSCMSFANTHTYAFNVPFKKADGSSHWNIVDEIRIWRAMSDLLGDPLVPKVLQNSLYDNFVLSWSYKCPIVNVGDDTMLKHWELLSEMPKSLGFQVSIYTKEPYYKSERKSGNLDEYHTYCCKDSAVTLECSEVMDRQLTPNAREHYKFNLDLLPALLYMQLRGIRYDAQKALIRFRTIGVEITERNAALSAMLGRDLNVESPKQMQQVLYDQLGFPPVLNHKTQKPTTNEEALLRLGKKTGHKIFPLLIETKKRRTRHSMLKMTADTDGRIRGNYNIVGTETGRLTCQKSPTGSGCNLQTIPEGDRDLFLADDDWWFFQADLSGADGWTVACHCANLGDRTMLDDLLAGIKIAKVIALLVLKGATFVSRLTTQAELKEACDTLVPKSHPMYHGAKACQHGSNYLMGTTLMSALIFKQSGGQVIVTAAECKKLQMHYFIRYPGVRKWHSWLRGAVQSLGYLDGASGHRRQFFGRRDDEATVKQAAAEEPQANTTYCTNVALHKLWHDPENRTERGSLIVQPLHQVHDAICGQFPKAQTAWAVDKLKEWFRSPVTIAGQTITIPFAGGYGPSWGNLPNEIES